MHQIVQFTHPDRSNTTYDILMPQYTPSNQTKHSWFNHLDLYGGIKWIQATCQKAKKHKKEAATKHL